MNLSVKFKGFTEVGDHFDYIIEVSNLVNGEIWKFQRRYSLLREIHEQFKSAFGVTQKFPPKKMFGNKNPKFLEQRRSDLETFFISITKMKEAAGNELAEQFFSPRDREIINSATATIKKPAQPAVKKSRIENEVKETSTKVSEALSSKLFDLSSQPMPLDEEEQKCKRKQFKKLCKDLVLSMRSHVPSGSEINIALAAEQVKRHDCPGKLLKTLINTYPSVARASLTNILN
ncbi:hypothetical protein SteCoe_22700 [Stentor coeruleus]|uniref:PX domain-containing protein n=1 Tax=Stentor coeruleus TaxID=5963 RepID=A0A1R2BLR3_9CILI|nr:hypothetical protein SteCoe_22700 [Stentor coeruleus]